MYRDRIEKIVTTEPSSTEIIAYLDNGVYRIMGVSDKCDYPAEVISKPKIVRSLVNIPEDMPSREIDRIIREYKKSGKPLFEIDWDLVRMIDPDLIVGQTLCDVCAFPLKTSINNYIGSKPVFRSFKVPKIIDYSPHSFMAIAEEALKIAKIIDRIDRGLELYDRFKAYREELKDLGKGHRTAVIEWLDPLYIAGHWVSDLVEYSGSKSILGSGEPGIRINVETLINFNPDIVIIAPCGFNIDRTLMEIDVLSEKPWWRNLEAVRRKNVYIVDSTYTARPSPRTIGFAEFLIDIYTGSQPSREIAVRIE